MTITRRDLLRLIGAGTATAALPGAFSSITQAAGAQAAGVPAAGNDPRPVLRIAVQALPASLEPLETISNIGLRQTTCLFDSPLRRDFKAEAATPGTAKIDPQLATAVTRIDDLTWRMTLRPGVTLHDGSTLSAADVAATFAPGRIGPDTPWPEGRILFGHLAEVRTVDALTVDLVTRNPDPVMPQRLAAYGAWIVGAKAMAAGGPETMRTAPVGAGPYKLAEFVRDTRLVLSSHDDYWMGRPAAREVRIEVVPEAATRIAGLISGEYDIVTNLLPDQMPQLDGYDDVEAVAVPLDLVHMLFYDTRRPAVADARIRQALNHAIDYDALGRAVWGERFSRPNGLQTPAFGPLYDADRRHFPFDPARAKALLAEAGYGGTPVRMRLISGYYVGAEAAGQIIQAMWAQIGVPLELEFVESMKQALEPGADVRMISAAFRFPDPLGGGVVPAWGPDSAVQKRGFWSSDRFNAAIAELRAAQETADRRRIFQHLLDLFDEEAPGVVLYGVNEVYGKRRPVNWTHYPLYYLDLRPDNLSFA